MNMISSVFNLFRLRPGHVAQGNQSESCMLIKCSVKLYPSVFTPTRNYFVDMPVTERSGETERQQGQTADRQLDGFEDVAEILENKDNQLFQEKNGYLTADEKQLDRFLKR